MKPQQSPIRLVIVQPEMRSHHTDNGWITPAETRIAIPRPTVESEPATSGWVIPLWIGTGWEEQAYQAYDRWKYEQVRAKGCAYSQAGSHLHGGFNPASALHQETK